jgi:hypothetical protein
LASISSKGRGTSARWSNRTALTRCLALGENVSWAADVHVTTNVADRWTFWTHDNDEFLLVKKLEDLTDDQGGGVTRKKLCCSGKLHGRSKVSNETPNGDE